MNKSVKSLNELLNITDEIMENKQHKKSSSDKKYNKNDNKTSLSAVGKGIKETEPRKIIEYKEPKINTDLSEDYRKVRTTLKGLIDNGADAIDKLLNLNSDNPRAYEVLSGLIKNVSDVAKNLLEIQKIKQDIENPKNTPPKKPEEDGGTINNITIYRGSTADLSKAIEEADEENNG